jgi:uncharacterized protein YjiS (DUF1127 family)
MLYQAVFQALSKRAACRLPRWGGFFDQLAAWRQRARERRLLSSFDDYMLKDIGISRADIEMEITKPFWQD